MTDQTTRRPWRPRNLVLAALAIVVISIAGWNVYRYATRTPAPVIDYAAKLQALAEADQPAGENGWPKFFEAAQISSECLGEIREGDYSYEGRGLGFGELDFGFGRMDPLDRALIRPELDALELLRERGVRDLLAEAAACPRAVREMPPNATLIDLLLPELARFRQLTKALGLEMRLAALDGNDAERVACFEQMLALVRASSGQATLINRLVGHAIVAFTTSELRCELDEAGVTPETGRALLGAIDRQLGPMLPLATTLEGERLMVLDMIQMCFTDNGHGDGRLNPAKFNGQAFGQPPPNVPLLNSFRGAILAGRAETTRATNEFFDKAIAKSRLDPVSRRDSDFDEDAFIQALGFRYTLVTALVPAISKGAQTEDFHRLNVEATRTLIAIEMFRSMHGRLPATLDDLAPEILPVVPVDPLHGGGFVYRVIGDGYEFYSTGLDQNDDSAGLGPADLLRLRDGGIGDEGTDVKLKRERERRDQ